MDSYAVLGIPLDANPAQIKRAYRRLAMAWHPDRNSHPEATERFKQIRAAYDALLAREDDPAGGDSEDRADDETADRTDGGPGRQESAPAAEPEAPRAPDIRLDLEITLEEGAAGCKKTIHYRRGKPCANCEGSGEAGITRSRLCGACHGSGRVQHKKHGLERCSECAGRGFFSQRVCPECAGSGRDEADAKLVVTVPKGMLPGDELRLAGQGEAPRGDLAAGDLFLTIRLKPHALFTLQGRDLALTVPVSLLALLAGGGVDIPLLHGSHRLELEPGGLEARNLRLAGLGYPGRHRGGAGDLVVNLVPVRPRHLDERTRKLLIQADAALEKHLAESLPEIAAWRAKLKGR